MAASMNRQARWLICGTVPDEAFPLTQARWRRGGEQLFCENAAAPNVAPLSIARGTPALVGACLAVCEELALSGPEVLLVGDTGTGEGSRALYAHLAATVREGGYDGIVFHYLFPDVDGHNRELMALEECAPRPLLFADAGFMYVAKMSGYADHYDLFTPDVGELAFLADETAPHPFYTRGFLLAEDNEVPALVARACAGGNVARHLLVKGKTDYVYAGETLVASVDAPCVPFLEPIGGTGDIVAGLVTAFAMYGAGRELALPEVCRLAAHAARLAGEAAHPNPATQVSEIMPWLGPAVARALETSGSGAEQGGQAGSHSR